MLRRLHYFKVVCPLFVVPHYCICHLFVVASHLKSITLISKDTKRKTWYHLNVVDVFPLDRGRGRDSRAAVAGATAGRTVGRGDGRGSD